MTTKSLYIKVWFGAIRSACAPSGYNKTKDLLLKDGFWTTTDVYASDSIPALLLLEIGALNSLTLISGPYNVNKQIYRQIWRKHYKMRSRIEVFFLSHSISIYINTIARYSIWYKVISANSGGIDILHTNATGLQTFIKSVSTEDIFNQHVSWFAFLLIFSKLYMNTLKGLKVFIQ